MKYTALAALAAVGAAVAIAIPTANASPSVPAHYSRPDSVVINTRNNGLWVAHCHNLHRPTSRDWVFGGCLPPKHSK